jgi:hypothetical protein
MIRQAHTMVDARSAMNLLKEFLQETAYAQSEEVINNTEHLGKLVFSIMNHGYLWLALVEDEPVGLLMASVEPNLWAPKYNQLRELVWFVKKEHRRSTLGGRLFKEYCAKGEQLLSEGKIEGYFTTRMSTTDEVGLERRGFRLTEKTYLKERT